MKDKFESYGSTNTSDRVFTNKNDRRWESVLENSSNNNYTSEWDIETESGKSERVDFELRDRVVSNSVVEDLAFKLPFLRDHSLTYRNHWMTESEVPHPEYEVITDGTDAILEISGTSKRVGQNEEVSVDLDPITVQMFVAGDEFVEVENPRNPEKTSYRRKGNEVKDIEVTPTISLRNFGKVQVLENSE